MKQRPHLSPSGGPVAQRNEAGGGGSIPWSDQDDFTGSQPNKTSESSCSVFVQKYSAESTQKEEVIRLQYFYSTEHFKRWDVTMDFKLINR